MKMSEYLRSTFPEVFEHLDSISSEFWTVVLNFLAQFEDVEESGVYKNHAIDHLSKDERRSLFYEGWKHITRLTEEGKDTARLQSIFLVLFAEEIVVSCEDGTVKITPRLEDALDYIRKFVNAIGKQKPIFVVDSYQPSVNFNSLFGQEVKHELWGEGGDPLHTNKTQLIICDTAHWGVRDFLKDKKLQAKTKSFVNGVLEVFPAKGVLIVTTNKIMHDIVIKWQLPKDLRVTWFRSDWMRGVSVEDRRITICIGGPYIPQKAYDASAKSFRIKNFARDLELLDEDAQTLAISKLLRWDDTKSEFINSIGRVKDPEGKERSVVFTLGMQGYETYILLKQDKPVSTPRRIQPFRRGGLLRDGLWIAKLWLDRASVEVKDLPIVARIIRYTKEKKAVSPSQVVPRHTKLVIEKAARYERVLEQYGIEIARKKGGVAFESTVTWR